MNYIALMNLQRQFTSETITVDKRLNELSRIAHVIQITLGEGELPALIQPPCRLAEGFLLHILFFYVSQCYNVAEKSLQNRKTNELVSEKLSSNK